MWEYSFKPASKVRYMLKVRCHDIFGKIHEATDFNGFIMLFQDVRSEDQIRVLIKKMEDYYERRNQSGYMSLFSRDFYSPVIGLETYQDVYNYVRTDFNNNSDIKILTLVKSIKNAGSYYLVTIMETFEANWVNSLVKYVENYTYSFRVKKFENGWKIIRFDNFRGTYSGGETKKGSIKAKW
ncbi:hypothetical protein KAJ27_14530, partial [bacterium]|nr:hypothetical protein [bacterium]